MTWRAVDLHIHTPASKDYQEQDATYLDILKKAESEGLDVIAFTDHNTVAGYEAMQREISDLERWEESGRLRTEERRRLEEYRRLTEKILVLPGFEFTATLGFHILAMFPPDTSIRALEHVLLTLNVPVDALEQGETEVGSTTDVVSAYRIMDEAGGLVIAAHVNSTHGVAMFGVGLGGQTRMAFTQDPHLHALEVTDLENRGRRSTASFFDGSKPEYPRRMHCIQGSDAHRIAGRGRNPGVGERATDLLLPEVSFEAIKQLFLEDDFERTRPYNKGNRRSVAAFDPVQEARKHGPTVVQSFHENMTRRGGCLHAIVADIVAFSNTEGGTIYVGVSQNEKAPPKGVGNEGRAIKTIQQEIERSITPTVHVEIDALKTQGSDVLRLKVPKGDDLPYVLEGNKFYLRRGSKTIMGERDEIVALVKRALGGQPPSKQPAPQERAKPAERAKKVERKEPAAARPSTNGVEPPKTGVEIAESEQRDGVLHHTMHDLRNGNKVSNVTRKSARKLWRYAIALKEKGTFDENKVEWHGNLGLWHKYFRSGRPHYDLVQKEGDGDVRVYYGVSEEGLHGPWNAVVQSEK